MVAAHPQPLHDLLAERRQLPSVGLALDIPSGCVRDQPQTLQARQQLRYLALIGDARAIRDLAVADARVRRDGLRRPVRLLADTHAALWLLDEDKRLSTRADELLTDTGNEVLLSAAVVWEVAIKRSLGKLDAPDGFAGQLLDGGAVPYPSTSTTHGRYARCHGITTTRSTACSSLKQPSRTQSSPRLDPYDVQVAW